ncbi:hypothetical protein Bbelb_313860 [Branchiostoma belcheri]|nr:hypothetical protein Bbelb_313860 [Branchiostoma belcheri]
MRLEKLLPNLLARYHVAAHVRTRSGTTRNRTRVSQFYSPVMYHYTTRRHSKRIKRAQNGTRPDCPEPYPEALSIINCVRCQARFWIVPCVSQNVDFPHARFGIRAECPKPCLDTVWDKGPACPKLCSVPRHGSGHALSVPDRARAWFGTRPSRVPVLNKHFVYLQVDLLYSVVDTRQDYPDPCVGLVDKLVLFPIPGLSLADARPTPEPDRDRPRLRIHPRRAPAQLGPKHNQSFGRLGGDFLPEHLLSQQASYSTDLSPLTKRRRDLIVRTPRGTPPVAGIPPGHISYVTDQMNRIKPMPARLLNPAGASRGYIPDGHRRISWRDHVTNAEVMQRAKAPPLSVIVMKRILSFAGHVWRLLDLRTTKAALTWKPEGTSPRGRPRVTLLKTLQNDGEILGLNSLKDMAVVVQDRNLWRKKSDKESTYATRLLEGLRELVESVQCTRIISLRVN